jgi:hypothetical protein
VSEGDMLRRVESHTLRHRSWWLQLLTANTRLRDEFVKSHSHKVVDVMTPKVLTVSPETPLGEIASVLEKNGIKRVPVVKDGKLVGIVSRANLLQAIATIGKTIKPAVTVDDATLREKVISQLNRQPLTWRSLINVIVHDGTAELWGMVDSESEKSAVRVAAEVTAGGASGRRQPDSQPDQIRIPMMSAARCQGTARGSGGNRSRYMRSCLSGTIPLLVSK